MKAIRAFALASLLTTIASAQPKKPPPQPTNFRAHVGHDLATRLLKSGDPDERLRGVERALAIGTPEAIALLVDALERGSQLKADTRALLAAARGLAPFAEQERARSGLLAILGAGHPELASGRLPGDDGDPTARAELARQVAAIALAKSGNDKALEALYGAARSTGSRQNAAMLALTIHPPREAGFFGTTALMPAATIRMLGQLGDLRALDVLHAAARSSDVGVRCAGLVALAELGDARAIALARAAIVEGDVRLRAASGEVFVLLGAGERFKATEALVADDATTAIGLRLAERVYSAEITKRVAARLAHPDHELRLAAIRALGRSTDPSAAKALTQPLLLGDPELVYPALHALARSPAANAGELVGGLLSTRLASLAVRAYVVRALVRGERNADDAAFRMAASRDPAERALGVFARVALGDASVEKFFADPSPNVRRAALMGSMAKPTTRSTERAFLARLAGESDPATRQLLALGLANGDPDGLVKTSLLVDRAESASGDAPLAAFALARRADDTTLRKVRQLLDAKDPTLRAHAARGLGFSALPDAAGRLAELYASDTDEGVRRAAIAALATRPQDANAPSRKLTLTSAAELDPDGAVRQAARRALGGSTTPFAPAIARDVAWLRIVRDDGAPREAFVGALVRADGLAVPIVFDEEGYAVLPGLPPGEARLVLAPRLPGLATK